VDDGVCVPLAEVGESGELPIASEVGAADLIDLCVCEVGSRRVLNPMTVAGQGVNLVAGAIDG
jgi:hypothetical protein